MKVWWVLSGIVGTFLAGNYLLRHREQRLAKARSGQGFEQFVSYFPPERFPRDGLRDVYEYFQNWQSVKNFPVDPNDDLYEVYGICDEDVDDAVVELAERWHKESPANSDIEGHPPIRTVADIVRLLSRMPEV